MIAGHYFLASVACPFRRVFYPSCGRFPMSLESLVNGIIRRGSRRAATNDCCEGPRTTERTEAGRKRGGGFEQSYMLNKWIPLSPKSPGDNTAASLALSRAIPGAAQEIFNQTYGMPGGGDPRRMPRHEEIMRGREEATASPIPTRRR